MKGMNYCTVGEELSLYIKWSLNSSLGEDVRGRWRGASAESEGRGGVRSEGRRWRKKNKVSPHFYLVPLNGRWRVPSAVKASG